MNFEATINNLFHIWILLGGRNARILCRVKLSYF